jgi:RNA polymerase sigma-54 factor
MLKQSLNLKLQQKLSPQQIQLMKLLQVPTVELEQRIKEEIEENPALEEGREESTDDADNEDENFEGEEISEAQQEFDINDYLDDGDTPSYKLSASNSSADDDEKAIPLSAGDSFHELLHGQASLRIVDERKLTISKHLIGNLDESGYLRRELENIVDDLAFSMNIMTDLEELEEILMIVQDLEPAGVGARSLKECLLIQMERKLNGSDAIDNAIEILEKHFEEFTKKHYDKILKKMGIDNQELKEAVDEIVKLNPKPGNTLRETSTSIQQIIPDFILAEQEGELQLSLNSRNAPQLKVSRTYAEMLQTYAETKDKSSKQQKEAVMFVKQKIDSAKWFIDAIRQRQQTLLLTMDAIMNYQYDYFMTGDETKLKPMILKDIAEIVGLDISTISRVANSKHVQTTYGTFLLKSFFSESLSTDSGEEVSTREVKKILQDNIDVEDKRKPLTDEKLASLLKEKGYNIARRTVAKYREQLNIPVARLRKQL